MNIGGRVLFFAGFVFLFLFFFASTSYASSVGSPIYSSNPDYAAEGYQACPDISNCAPVNTCWNGPSVGTPPGGSCSTACPAGDGGQAWYRYDYDACVTNVDFFSIFCFPWFSISQNSCSIGDKYNSSNTPVMNAGSCTCSALGPYKTCCNGTTQVPASNFQVDPYAPDEADCGGNSTVRCGGFGEPACGQAACNTLAPPPPSCDPGACNANDSCQNLDYLTDFSCSGDSCVSNTVDCRPGEFYSCNGNDRVFYDRRCWAGACEDNPDNPRYIETCANGCTNGACNPPPGGPPTVDLSASPASINSGQSTTLNWTVSNATSCTASVTSNPNGISQSPSWSGSKNAGGGNQSIQLTGGGTIRFNLECSGPGGTGSDWEEVTVQAAAPSGAPPTPTPTPTPTSTPVPSGCSSNTTCSNCITDTNNSCGWNGSSCEPGTSDACPAGHTQWYWNNCSTNECSGVTPAPTGSGSGGSGSRSKSGTVFVDSNDDGIWDTGEPAYKLGATVSMVYLPPTGGADQPRGSAVTDVNGNYKISFNLCIYSRCSYRVTLTVPAGYAVTTGNPVSWTWCNSDSCTDAQWDNNLAPIDFGLGKGKITGNVYVDTNKNGAKDRAEFFDDDNWNGVWDPGEPYTDTNGNGWRDWGEPYTDTNGNGWYNRAEDFWDDNGNGVWDPAELGYNGATVSVSGPDNRTATTDASGNYILDKLPGGSYSVALTVPAGYVATTTNPRSVNLTRNTTVNFGIARTPYQCSDTADNDADGLVDSADPGCHTDGNPGNPGSYDPNDNNEGLPPSCPGGLTSDPSSIDDTQTAGLIVSGCVPPPLTYVWPQPTAVPLPPGGPGTTTNTNNPTSTYTPPAGGVCSVTTVTQNVEVTGGGGTSAYSTNINVTPKNMASGGVFEDRGGNNCASGSTPHPGAVVTLYTSGGSPTGSDTSDAGGSYSVTDNDACGSRNAVISSIGGYNVKAARFDGGAWGASNLSGYTYGPFDLSSDHTLDFCISNLGAWFQTTTGDVRMPNLTNKIPAGLYSAADPSSPSLYYSSSFNTNFGDGAVSARGWKVDDEYSYQEDSKNRNGTTSYSFYESRAKQRNVVISSLSCNLSACDISSLDSGLYKADGDLTITSYTHKPGAHILLLVNGDLTIQSNISVPAAANNLLIIAAKGNIGIDASIGTTTLPSNTAQIEGIISAEGSITIDGDACPDPTPRKLNIGGALVANSLKPFTVGGAGSFVNNRSLCARDADYASVKVAPRHDFVTQLTDFYRTPYSRWREVAP